MHFIRKLLLFIKNNFMQLQRKWLSLPLLLLFPIIIVALVLTIIIAFFLPSEEEEAPIHVGLVDLDQSTETQLVVQLIDETPGLGSYIQIHNMSKQEADEAINNNELSSYIIFPESFTNNLYQGNSVNLPIIGNPNQPTQSYLIKELIESVIRHIRASQANILTINHYAKELSMDSESRNDLLFEQFKEFVFYTIGKDRIINNQEITNNATTSPMHYYGLASWFTILTIWLLSIYSFLCKEDTLRMKQRMKLYGVTEIQQLLARMFVTIVVTSSFASGSFFSLQLIFEWDINFSDYTRIFSITLLYSILFLEFLTIIEMILPSQKLRLLVQTSVTGMLLLVSGSIIPIIYFPLQLQAFLDYSFSTEAFHWLQEILLNNRLYTDYIPLLLMTGAGLLIFIAISIGKERVQE